ncbi:HAD family hydrolase [Euzebya tangerina]|uniref:HAD family hydrolase n=1 Tax=Euzebya tangerina TaxID=591198 RepID=UPI000E320AA0|nr:HAD-IA family hydrolase [Euzebya tangerina]
MPAILFGSISSVVDTSELQRQAFNDAFQHHGLNWHWDQELYRDLLQSNGGAQRIAAYGADRGVEVDADAVHATKSSRFQQLLAETSPSARPGVLETIRAAQASDVAVGMATTTSPLNVAAILRAAGISQDELDLVLTREDVDEGKPAPEVYLTALQQLELTAEECIAVEDNVGGVDAAADAGIRCVALPNANTARHDFGRADQVEAALDPAALVAAVSGTAAAS